jgi:hypothetical protein
MEDTPSNSTIGKASADRVAFFWGVMNSFDKHIEAVNNEAALVFAYDTFILGAIVIKSADATPLSDLHPYLRLITALLILLASAPTVFAIWKAIEASIPRQIHPKHPCSAFGGIFGHIQLHQKPGA